MESQQKSKAQRSARPGAALGVALVCAAACGDIPLENEPPPAGIIEGVVVYSGPLPCVQRGRVLGAAVLLAFDERLLPPPQGLGSTARSVAVVQGDTLFAGVSASLPASSKDDDTVRCPADDGQKVSVSARWSVGPLPAGRYQVRGFYDRDGDFSPVLRTHNLPTAGDIAGGAIANAAEALQGKAPVYQTIEVGAPNAAGKLEIPKLGALVDGVTVNLGLTLPTSRPISHIGAVLDERPGVADGARQTDPKKVVVPVDMRFSKSPTANPTQADREFIRLVLKPSLPEGEVAAGLAPPISLQVGPPFTKLYVSARRGASGEIESTPEGATPAIAELFPQVVLSKINEAADSALLTSQASPAVIASGLVTFERLTSTTVASWEKRSIEPVDELRVLVRPSVICTTPSDPDSPLYLVTTSLRSRPTEQAPDGEPVVNPGPLRANLAARFNKPIDKVKVVEGCLPPGKFGLNLVYGTGQAWSLPNEAGRCRTPLELPEGAGCKQSGQPARPLLPSQADFITFGGVQEDAYCDQIAQRASSAAPANGADALALGDYVAGVPAVCLTEAERSNPETLRQLMRKTP